MSRNGNRVRAQINGNWACPKIYLGLLCFLFGFIHGGAASQNVSLAWDPNTETNLAGYVVQYGTASGQYSVTNDVGRVTNTTVSGLLEGTTYFFVVRAYDTVGLESDPSNEVSYQAPTASGPVLSIISNQTTPEDTVKLVSFTASAGANSSGLSLTATSSDSTLVPLANIVLTGSAPNYTASLKPQSNLWGTATITIVASNGTLSASRSFVLTVNSANDVPTLNPLGNLAILEDAGQQTVALSGITSGAPNESQVLTVTATSSNPTLIPNPVITYASPNATATLRFTPLTNANGSATITVTVNDGQANNNLVTRTFDVSVAAVNDAPTISVIASQQTAANTPSQVIPFTVRDVESSLSSLVLAASSSNPTLVPLNNIVFGGSGSNRTVQLTPAVGQSGQAGITLSVTDGLLTAATTFLLTVIPPSNSPPVISAISAQVTTEDTSKQVPFTASAGTNSSGLSLTAASSDPTLVPLANIDLTGSAPNFTASITPQSNLWGTATITIVASNGTLSASRSFVLTVNSANDLPTLNPLGNLAIIEDAGVQTVALSGISSGAPNENQTLTVTATSSNPTLIPNPIITYASPNATGSLRFTPLTNANGTATVTVTVDDGQANNNVVTRSFDVSVAAVNDGPTISAIANQQTSVDTPSQVIPFTVRDVESSLSSLVLDASSSDTALVPLSNIVFGGSGSNRTVQLTPAAGQTGQVDVVVSVSDGLLTAVSTFVLTVLPAPIGAPAISAISSQATSEDTLKQVPFTASAGANSSVLNLTASSSDSTLVPLANIVLTGSAPNFTASITPQSNLWGTATITIVASNEILSASRSFVLTVNSANDLPTLDPLGNLAIVEDAGVQTVALSGISSGAPNENQTLTVTATSSNPTLIPNPIITYASPNTTATLRFTPLTNANGTATVTVTVNDGQANNNVVTRTFDVSVAAVNDAPTISAIASQQTIVNTPSQVIPFTVRDVESLSLVLAASSSDTALVPLDNIVFGGSGSSRTVQLIPAAGQTGQVDVVVSVTDGLLTATSTFVLTVLPAPIGAPVISAISSQTTSEDTVKLVPFTASEGANSSVLNLTASSSDSTLVPLANIVLTGSAPNFTASITPQSNLWGTATITIVASNEILSASRSFVLTVNSANDLPTLDPLGNLAILEDAGLQTVALSGISSGAPNENQTLTVTATSSNPTLIPNPVITYTSPNATGTLRFTPLANANGTATITVTVNDGQANNNLVARSFDVSVAAINDAPTISAIASQQTDEDVPLTAGISVSDRETMNLTLWATSTNTALVPNSNISFGGGDHNRTITVIPAANLFGTTFITAYVSDGVATNSAGFVFTVNPVNDFPTLNVIPNFGTISADNGVYVISIDGISSGANNENQPLVITADSSNPSLLPDPFVGYNGTATNGTLVLRPGNGRQGNATVTVTVQDAGATNNTFVRTFQVNINAPANIGPTMSLIPNQTTAEDTALGPMAFTVGDSTTAAGSLTLRADSSNPALLPIDNIIFGGSGANRTLTLIPAHNQSGVATVYLTVIDNAFGSSNQMFTVTVNAVNDRPAITGLAAQSVAQDTPVGPLAFNVTDPETPSGSLIVTASSGNEALVPNANIVLDGIGANRTVRLTPASGLTGQASITLSVTDGSLTTTASFLLTVSPPSNGVPTISAIADQVTDDMTPLEAIPFTVGDAETPAQNLEVSALSSNPTLLPSTNLVIGGSGAVRTVTIVPVPGQAGTAVVSIAVSDGAASVTTSFRLSVATPSPAVVVNIEGEGDVLPNLSGRALVRGQSYNLTARPGPGQIFVGWSGAVTSSAPSLRFTMRSNLMLIANFMANPYTPVRGTYSGLFYEADEVRHERSGFFKVITTAGGAYTGTLGLGSRIHPISGRLDTDRRATNTIRRIGATALQLEFQLGTETTLDGATGRVTDGDWVAALLAERSLLHTATNPSPFAGRYTAVIPGNPNSSESPGGDGFGSVTVGPGGNALLTGLTGDNQPLTRVTPLSERGAWPLYIPLYGGKGSILGWINVTNRSTDDLTGPLSWIRPGIRSAKYYSSGFTNETFLVGSSYEAPATKTNRMMELTNCLVTFSGGNLTETFANNAILGANNVLTNTSSNKMVATLALSSGLFSGSVVNPATGKSLTFRGALLQKRTMGSGFFSGTNETGRVWLGP